MKIIIEGDQETSGVLGAIAAMIIYDLRHRKALGTKFSLAIDPATSDAIQRKIKRIGDALTEYNGSGDIESELNIELYVSARTKCPSCGTLCGWEATATRLAQCQSKEGK